MALANFAHLEAKDILVEVKASYYHSTNHRFRDVYGGAGLYRIEGNFQTWNDLYSWVSLGYLYGNGRTNLGSHSHIHLVPLTFGISYYFKWNRLGPYLGIGPLLAYSHIDNGSSGVSRNQDGWGGGFISKAGFIAPLT